MALRTPLSVTPHLYMGDSTGRPLDMGTVYFGEQDKDPEFYPINLFSDDALTKPLMQPVHTKGGYLYDKGDMVEPHAKEIIYSVKVLDSYGRKVFYKGAMMRNSWNDDVIEQINQAVIGSADVARQVATDITNEAINNTAIEGGVLTDTFLTATAYHPDTYARTQRSIRADTVSMLDFIPLDLHAGIKSYTYADDLKAYIQKAIDYCVLNNKKLNVPAGGYMFDPAYVPIYLINHWGANKNLIMEGAGQGLSIFKEKTGASIAGGRFTKMFYLYYGLAGFVGDFGHIKFSGITFDKNASTSINDKGLYEYEQAHIIGAAGSGTVNIKSVQFDDLELKDKIGAGINFSSAPNVKIRKVLCSNVFSRNHPKVTNSGDGTFGQRGCLEFGTNIDTVDIVNCDVIYAQIEPVIASSPTLQRFANVSGGKIDSFEWTDKGGYSFANVVNLTCSDKFLVRGVNVNATNSTLMIRENITEGIVKITGGTILLKYDATTNAISQFVHGTATGYTDYGELWLSNLDIKINSPDSAILPTGAAITGGTAGLKGSRKRYLNNVKFDPRLEQSIDAYGNGDWKITNCDLYGRTFHVGIGGTGTVRGGNVELANNNYLGAGSKVQVYKNNALWSAQIVGSYPYTNFYNTTGATDYGDLITVKPTLTSTTKPTTGSAPRGQIVANTNPVAEGYEKWIKMAEAGQTWRGIGLIEANPVVP